MKSGSDYVECMIRAIEEFWYRDPENSKEMVQQTERKLIGKLSFEELSKFDESLPFFIREWKYRILEWGESSDRILAGKAPDIKELSSLLSTQSMSSLNSSVNSLNSSVLETSLLSSLIEQAALFNREDKVVEAYRILQKLTSIEGFKLEEHMNMREIEENYADMEVILSLVQDQEGWIPESTEGAIKIYYKKVEGTPTISLLTESTLNISTEHFLSIFFETDLYPNWIPFCKHCSLLKQLGTTKKILLQKFKVAGLIHRDACLYAYAVNRLSVDGTLLLCARSCDDQEEFKGVKLPETGNAVRAKVLASGVCVRPLTRSQVSVRMVSNFDPKVKKLPYKLLNYFNRKLAKGIFKKIAVLAANYRGSEYEAARNSQKNKDFYEMSDNSLEEFYKQSKM